MDYQFLPEVAREMFVPVSLLKSLCEQRRIKGAVRFGRIWMRPCNLNRTDVDLQLSQAFLMP